MVILYRRFGTRSPSWISRTLKMGPIGFPETSVQNYHSTLRNIPEERRSNLHRGGSLISRNTDKHLGMIGVEFEPQILRFSYFPLGANLMHYCVKIECFRTKVPSHKILNLVPSTIPEILSVVICSILYI
jgi:hypothetical protein